MLTLTILVSMFVATLFVYIAKAVRNYKKNPTEVNKVLKEKFDLEPTTPSERSKSKRFAAHNNRKWTPGRRWQYIIDGQGFVRRIHHDCA